MTEIDKSVSSGVSFSENLETQQLQEQCAHICVHGGMSQFSSSKPALLPTVSNGEREAKEAQGQQIFQSWQRVSGEQTVSDSFQKISKTVFEDGKEPKLNVFAQMLIPGQIKETGLEGSQRDIALGLFENLLTGFKDDFIPRVKGTGGDRGRSCLDKMIIEGCAGELKNLKSQLERIDEINDTFREKIENYDSLSDQELISKLGESEEINHEVDNLFAMFDTGGFGDIPCFNCGYNSTSTGHCAYVVFTNVNGMIYATEFNAGFGFDVSDITKKDKALYCSLVEDQTIYSNAITPGRTVCLGGREKVSTFLITLFRLLSKKTLLPLDSARREYERMWEIGELCNANSESMVRMVRPKFTDSQQKSGNCCIKSTDILIRAFFEYRTCALSGDSLAGLDLDKKYEAANLCELFRLYYKITMISACFNWHENNKSLVTRDSLDILRRSVDALATCIQSYHFYSHGEPSIDNDRLRLLTFDADNIIENVTKYLQSDEVDQIILHAEEHKDIEATIDANLNTSAKNKAKQCAERVNEVNLEVVQNDEHITFDEAKIASDPKSCLEISGRIAKCMENFKKLSTVRKYELVHSATELLRAMPFPESQQYDNYITKLSNVERRGLIANMSVIVHALSNIESINEFVLHHYSIVVTFLRVDPRGKNETEPNNAKNQLVDEKHALFPLYELAPIVNAITKARILTFAIAKKDEQLGNHLKSYIVEYEFFTGFCKSAINFSTNSVDAEEQVKIWNHIRESQSNDVSQRSTVLFDRTKPKILTRGNAMELGNPTLEWLNSVCNSSMNIQDLFEILNKLRFGGLPPRSVISKNPGLLFYVPIDSEIIESVITDGEAKEYAKFLANFLGTMTHAQGSPFDNENMVGTLEIVLTPDDTLSEKNSGYNLAPENVSIMHANGVDEKSVNVANIIKMQSSTPDTQTFGLLQVLGEHLEICGENNTKDQNMWLQVLCRTLFPWQYENSQNDAYKVKSPECPLRNDAKNRPYELLIAAKSVWEKGKRELWENTPGRKASVGHLCNLIHIMHIICKSIIENAGGNSAAIKNVKNFLSSLHSDIHNIRSGLRDNVNGNNKMLLRLAESECIFDLVTIAQNKNETVDDDLLLTLYENLFWLQKFGGIGLQRGKLDAIYGIIPLLLPYLAKNPNQALEVAKKLHQRIVVKGAVKNTDISGDKTWVALKSGDEPCYQFKTDNDYVDFASFRIFSNGKNIKGDEGDLLLNGDYRRLFCAQRLESREIVRAGNNYTFHDDGMDSDICIQHVPEEGKNKNKTGNGEIKIYRKFKESSTDWCYISPKNIVNNEICLPHCFAGREFTVWADTNGQIKICSLDNPNDILYETDADGHLCDLKRPNMFISFYSQNGSNVQDKFSRFEDRKYTLFYCDKEGKILEVVMPRYRTPSGGNLRFLAESNGSYVLASNPNYKLVNAPCNSLHKEQNPLIGCEFCMWLKTTDQNGKEKFLGLIPDVEISRDRGITHDIKPLTSEPSENKDFWDSAKYGEVVFDGEHPDTVSVHANDTLSNLRLAHIFQSQGEYGKACEFLDRVQDVGKLSPDEIAMFSLMIKWFNPDRGHEQSPLAALVVLKAMSRMLQISPFGEESKEIIKEVNLHLFALINIYFSGFELYPLHLQFNYDEEILLWRNFCMILPEVGCPEIGDIILVADIRIHNLEKLKHEQSVQAELDGNLTFPQMQLLNDRDLHFKDESIMNDRKDHEFEAFKVENIAFHVDKTSDYDDTPSKEPPDMPTDIESEVRSKLEEISRAIFGKIESPESDEASGSENESVKSIGRFPLTPAEEKEFGPTLDTVYKEFNKELVLGEKSLEKAKGETVKEIPSDVEIKSLIVLAKSKREKAKEAFKSQINYIQEIANVGRQQKTHNSSAWKNLKMYDARRAYSLYLSFRDAGKGKENVLRYLQDSHPWFRRADVDNLIKSVGFYLDAINSFIHLTNVIDSLEKVSTTDGAEKTAAWSNALPILRQTCVGNAGNEREKGCVKLFNFMTGIRPRLDQMEKMKLIIKKIEDMPNKRFGLLIQQIMGSGKTKVLLPFIVMLLCNRKDLMPIIVSHISQMPAVLLELRPMLGVIGIRLDAFDASYRQLSDEKELEIFRRKLEISFEKRNSVFAIPSHTILALRTVLRATLANSQQNQIASSRKITELTKIFEILKCRGVALMDEVHLTLNPKESFITQPPSETLFSGNIPPKDVSFVVELINDLPTQLRELINKNIQDHSPTRVIESYLIEHIRDSYCQKFDVPDDLKLNFAKFVCGKFDGVDGSNELETKSLGEVKNFLAKLQSEKKHNIALLRKSCSTLIRCLAKAYIEHYGFDDKGDIVPYRNRMPSNNHYGDPYETLCYFALATTAHGIPAVTLSNWIKGLAVAAATESSRGVAFDETQCAKSFKKSFNTELSSMVDFSGGIANPKVLAGKIDDFLKKLEGMKVQKLKLISEFGVDQTKHVKDSYSTASTIIPKMFLSQISMSGTTDNKESYEPDARRDISSQPGELGKITVKMIELEKNERSKIVEVGEKELQTVGGMLRKWSETSTDQNIKNLQIIVDGGAQFKNQENRLSVSEIAQFLKKNTANKAKYIEYFDEKLNEFAIVSVEDAAKGPSFIPKKVTGKTDRPKNSDELFTFLDSPRATGTDPFMSKQSHGITTVNLLRNDISEHEQAVMRARNLLNIDGQTMDIVVQKESREQVFGKNSMPKMSELTSLLVRNMARNITQQHIQAVSHQLNEIPKLLVEKIILSGLSPSSEILEVTKRIITSVDTFAVDQWSGSRNWEEVNKLLVDKWNKVCKDLQQSLFDDSKNETIWGNNDVVKFDCKASFNLMKKTANKCIKEISKDLKVLCFEGAGASAISEDDGREIEVQMEIEQEQKRELEVEKLLQIQFAAYNENPLQAKALEEPAFECTAFDAMGKWQCSSLADRIRNENAVDPSYTSKEGISRYNAAKSIFQRNFDEIFFATDNFLKTTEGEDSVFQETHKDARYLLILWDESNGPKERCLFVSQYDAGIIRSMIERGKITNCHLCTADGNSIANNSTLPDRYNEFLQESCWMAHFLNADVKYLDTHPNLTKKMLDKIAQAQSEQGVVGSDVGFDKVRDFLLLRSRNQNATNTALDNSSFAATLY
ncbi:MAG: hypothetical protein LBB18_03315 [Puniceicoccales bacterium]|jgi:hypothetical protein|nr:hypothetical protein [Puniceicoccales bacterium]